MFCGNDDGFHTRIPGCTRPLPCIQICRVEYLWILSPIAPFLIRKGIRPKVNKHIIFYFLPAKLIVAWHGSKGTYRRVDLSVGRGNRKGNTEQKNKNSLHKADY